MRFFYKPKISDPLSDINNDKLTPKAVLDYFEHTISIIRKQKNANPYNRATKEFALNGLIKCYLSIEENARVVDMIAMNQAKNKVENDEIVKDMILSAANQPIKIMSIINEKILDLYEEFGSWFKGVGPKSSEETVVKIKVDPITKTLVKNENDNYVTKSMTFQMLYKGIIIIEDIESKIHNAKHDSISTDSTSTDSIKNNDLDKMLKWHAHIFDYDYEYDDDEYDDDEYDDDKQEEDYAPKI